MGQPIADEKMQGSQFVNSSAQTSPALLKDRTESRSFPDTNSANDMAFSIGGVQAVARNHHVPQVLLSGSFDHTVVMKDGRIPSHTGFKWSVSADVETVAWDPHTEHSFVRISVVLPYYYGVFPLRGKLLNVREASHKQIMENAEIQSIKQILGLQHGKTV
ncbi:unnamed protein product [Camellia sinensis]